MRRYQKQSDASVLKAWAGEALANDAPKLGEVVGDDSGLIAIGFLRMFEGGYAVVDSLIVDPKSVGKRRSRALDVLVERLLRLARVKQLRGILAATVESAIVKRALRHGFELLPHRMLGMRGNR